MTKGYATRRTRLEDQITAVRVYSGSRFKHLTCTQFLRRFDTPATRDEILTVLALLLKLPPYFAGGVEEPKESRQVTKALVPHFAAEDLSCMVNTYSMGGPGDRHNIAQWLRRTADDIENDPNTAPTYTARLFRNCAACHGTRKTNLGERCRSCSSAGGVAPQEAPKP